MGNHEGMGLLIIVILIIAAVTGTLWGVLKIAAGVALGIFLAAVLLAVLGFYFFRSRVRRVQREFRSRFGSGDEGGGGPPQRR